MKKLLLLILFIALLIPTNVQAYMVDDPPPIPPVVTQIQYYDPMTGEIVCWSACWHEVAHKLDYEVMDNVSQNEDFHNQVEDFLYTQMFFVEDHHPMAGMILRFPGFFNDSYIMGDNTSDWAGYVWGGWDELYAQILYWANGDINEIPQNLREFYNMEEAIRIYNEASPLIP